MAHKEITFKNLGQREELAHSKFCSKNFFTNVYWTNIAWINVTNPLDHFIFVSIGSMTDFSLLGYEKDLVKNLTTRLLGQMSFEQMLSG